MKKFSYFLLLGFFCFLSFSSSVRAESTVFLNEVHPAGKEWVELYNTQNHSIVLNDWEIGDGGSNDSLQSLEIANNSLALLIDNELNCSNFGLKLSCREFAAIGNGLNNGGENLTLYNSSGSIVDNISWTGSEEETSLGRYPDGESWNQSLTPTPGAYNFQNESSENETNETEEPEPENQSEGSNSTNCDYSVQINSSQMVHNNSQFNYDLILEGNLSQTELEVNYRIEDLEGEAEHEYSNNYTVNQREVFDRSWTPGIESGLKAFWIKANLSCFSCDDKIKENNFDKQLLVIENRQEESQESSQLQILDYPRKVSFGQIFKVKAKAYRNDTDSYAVYARIEREEDNWDVSQETVAYLRDKNTEYTLSMPLIVKPNCRERFDPGDYNLIVSGLKEKVKEEISIKSGQSDLCQTVEETKVKEVAADCSVPKETDFETPNYELFDWTNEVNQGGEVKSYTLLRNRENNTKNLTVYSYIYDSRNLVSNGSWTENEKNLELAPGENRLLVLKNVIRSETEPGTYDFKVRIRGEKDLTGKVKVEESEEIEEIPDKFNESNQSDNVSSLMRENRSIQNRSEVIVENSSGSYNRSEVNKSDLKSKKKALIIHRGNKTMIAWNKTNEEDELQQSLNQTNLKEVESENDPLSVLWKALFQRLMFWS